MFENKFITDADVQDAKGLPLKLVRSAISGNEAPYFVDMVKDHLLENIPSRICSVPTTASSRPSIPNCSASRQPRLIPA